MPHVTLDAAPCYWKSLPKIPHAQNSWRYESIVLTNRIAGKRMNIKKIKLFSINSVSSFRILICFWKTYSIKLKNPVTTFLLFFFALYIKSSTCFKSSDSLKILKLISKNALQNEKKKMTDSNFPCSHFVTSTLLSQMFCESEYAASRNSSQVLSVVYLAHLS